MLFQSKQKVWHFGWQKQSRHAHNHLNPTLHYCNRINVQIAIVTLLHCYHYMILNRPSLKWMDTINFICILFHVSQDTTNLSLPHKVEIYEILFISRNGWLDFSAARSKPYIVVFTLQISQSNNEKSNKITVQNVKRKWDTLPTYACKTIMIVITI